MSRMELERTEKMDFLEIQDSLEVTCMEKSCRAEGKLA